MYEISKHIDRPTMEAILIQAWKAFETCSHTTIADQEKCTTMRQEITSLLYVYLERHTMINEVMPMCKALLQKKDIRHFKKFHEYNYNKLLITLNTTNDD